MKSHQVAVFFSFLFILFFLFSESTSSHNLAALAQEISPLIKLQDELLTVHLHQIPWAVVLEELHQQTGILFRIEGSLEGTVTEDFTDLPLEKGLRRLLRTTNLLLLYSKTGTEGAAESRLSQVWILPREKGDTSETPPKSPQSTQEGEQTAEGSVEAVIKDLLMSVNLENRDQAIEALAQYEDPQIWSALVHMLEDPDEQVRWRAAEVLADLMDAAFVESLGQMIEEEVDQKVRESVLNTLGEMGGSKAIEGLEKSLEEDKETATQENMVYLLEDIGGEEAIEALQQAMQDKDKAVQEAAEEMLKRLNETKKLGD